MWLVSEVGIHAARWVQFGLLLVSASMVNFRESGARPSSAPRRKVDLQSLLQSLPEAVFLFDVRSRITDLNKPAEELTGESRRELLGRDVQSLANSPSGAGSEPESIVARALRDESVRHERHTLRLGRGEPLEVIISASPMHDRSGHVIGALVVLQDVTELTALQRQMASSERHFVVGQMTAGLAHDFNNVLNAISQAVNVMQAEHRRSNHDRTMLGIIQNAVHRGSEIVANIREYLLGTREARSRIDLGRLVDEVLDLARPMLELHKNIHVVRQLEAACTVFVNPPELRRVFTNLVLNAVDAMPGGGTLTVSCSRSAGNVVVTVSDTGTGIPREKQNMIFSPYFTTKPAGTGLGLAGARRAVQEQGGEIRFESSPGAGTNFYVLLPLANGNHRQALSAA